MGWRRFVATYGTACRTIRLVRDPEFACRGGTLRLTQGLEEI